MFQYKHYLTQIHILYYINKGESVCECLQKKSRNILLITQKMLISLQQGSRSLFYTCIMIDHE